MLLQHQTRSSLGIPENSENVIRMANGSASVVCISDKPICVSSRPVSMNRTANGNASNGKGKARVIRIMTRKNSFPTKSNRESAYPAGAPSPISYPRVARYMSPFRGYSASDTPPELGFGASGTI